MDGLWGEVDEGWWVGHLVDHGGPGMEARPPALREARLRDGIGADGRQRHRNRHHHDEGKASLAGETRRGVREGRGSLRKRRTIRKNNGIFGTFVKSFCLLILCTVIEAILVMFPFLLKCVCGCMLVACVRQREKEFKKPQKCLLTNFILCCTKYCT